jgi:hypothetical protein
MSKLTVKVTGGLGNQLFKSLAGLEFAKKLNCDLFLDISWFNMKKEESDPVSPRKFEISAFPELRRAFDILSQTQSSLFDVRLGQIMRWSNGNVISKLGYITDSNYLRIKSGKRNYILDGNFANWRLLPPDEEVKSLLKFSFDKTAWFDEMKQSFANSKFIAVHIRRGDYVRLPAIYDVLTLGYYLKAIEIARQEVGNLPIVLFSDDIQEAQKWISNSFPVEFNVPNVLGESSVEVLELMSLGTAIVCAHSTFSWWSAKIGSLAKSTNCVVIPSRFFSHGSQVNHDLRVPSWKIVDV